MSNQSSPTILIVDDEQLLRETLRDILELNGYTTIVATNGLEAVELARRDNPALVITDVAMPVMTGFQLLEEFRRDPALRTIPVIVVSAKTERAAVRHGMELGASDFITKPFTEEEVLRSVATRLEKKELMDELDAFSHTVAHDLKNPLATLLGRLQLLGMMLDTGSPEMLRRNLDSAHKSAVRLEEILEELLILAGVRRQEVARETVAMGPVVSEALDRIDALLKESKAEVQVPEVWPECVGHAPWITQIWVNYISNAAKYGGVPPKIELGGEPVADGKVRFWVRDHGPGLDAAGVAQMFVPFTRISSIRAKGHGLGLSIVRRIAEKLGGSVGVETSPGQGARFWFELPAANAPKAAE